MTAYQRWFSNPTQIYWTCKALIEGRTISHKTEIREVKGWRLAAIVHRLKDSFNWPIVTEFRGPDNIAHYRLSPGTDPSRLKFPPQRQATPGRSQGAGMTRYRMKPYQGQWWLYATKPTHKAQGAAQLALCTCGNPHTLRRVLRALQRLEAHNG